MASEPTIPDVAAEEGICPTPEENLAFQKDVMFMLAGLNLFQSYKKVFGPVPKTGLSLSDFVTMLYVADHDGLTSARAIFNLSAILPASLFRTKNAAAKTKAANATLGKRPRDFQTSAKTSKLNKPKTSHESWKLYIAIMINDKASAK